MSLYQQSESHLVQFNAGKCIRDGNMLKPDLRKGMIYMDQGDDQLMHFYWKERHSNSEPEDDLIIFPEEAELLPVPECTTGRVIVLKYKTSSLCFFYWMQHLDDGMDASVMNRVNYLIDNPSSAFDQNMEFRHQLMRSATGQGNLTEENLLELFQQAEPLGHDDNNETDNNTTHATVPSTIGTAATPSTDLPSPSEQPDYQDASTTETVDPEHYEQLRSMLAGIQQADRPGLHLGDVLTSQTLTSLLNDTQVCDALYAYLPDSSERTPEEVRQVVSSPQFQQALHSLSAALQTGQLGSLLTQLGLDASSGNGVESFLKAINDQARKKDNGMDED